ncbi:MAG TPA: serine/threonine-protein kinase [Anaeromyxobacteraceae bacterium]|nr:serine/threonine-protein kinase [Anaeromyxobacteraceae bacterium]
MPESRAYKTPDLAGLVGAKLGNYRLERVIGRGRMGVVYLAQDEALLRPTAVKVLSWRAAEANGHDPVQWFLAEARLIARLNHPRVVQIYGAARQAEHCYIAMEYVPGPSAEAAVAQGGPLSPERATDALAQAAAALHAAHRSGIVHRDVKPANLLMGAGGVVKLGDFGMALGSAGPWTGNAHLRVGTPYYTAPEVWSGEAATPASDIYSLGASYFQLLTGRPPYDGEDLAAIEQAHLRAPVPDPRQLVRDLPPACAALLERALAKSPRARHASAEVLLWDARRILQDLASMRGSASAVPLAPAPDGEPAPAERRPPPPAPAPLARALGLVRRPFADVDPEEPYRLDPLATVRRMLLGAVEDPSTMLVTLAGSGRSGRGALCRAVASDLGASRRVLSVSLDELPAGGLLEHLCRAAGAPDEHAEEARANALVERLSEERRAGAPPALVIADAVDPASGSFAAVARVVAAALWTGAYKVVLAGEPGLAAALAGAGVDFPGGRAVELEIPRFRPEETARYVRTWLEAALGRGAPPILLSADAALLLARRSEGEVERLNCIAENMLMLAAAERKRVLTTWHVWAASDGERWAETRPLSEMPRPPAHWPPEEVVLLIDACRRSAGLDPWPRGASPLD